jgi:ABC-type oligopeptide transport system substrate-binding subunit
VWVADYPDTDSFVQSLLHTEEGSLGQLCGSAEIDHLIERGRSETDPVARHFVYQHIEEVIAREVLMIPLFHRHNYRFARPEVEGLSINSFTYPSVAYEKLWLR